MLALQYRELHSNEELDNNHVTALKKKQRKGIGRERGPVLETAVKEDICRMPSASPGGGEGVSSWIPRENIIQLEGATSAKALRQELTGTSRSRQQGGWMAEQREGKSGRR